MKKISKLIQKVKNFEIVTLAISPGEISRVGQALSTAMRSLFEALKKSYNIIPHEVWESAIFIVEHVSVPVYGADILPQIIKSTDILLSAWKYLSGEESSSWRTQVSPKAEQVKNLATQQLANFKAWREQNPEIKQGEFERSDMKKYDSLLKKIEFFEKVAEYSDRESFLKSLSQPFGFSGDMAIKDIGPGLTQFPNSEIHPTQVPQPSTTGKIHPTLKDGDYIDPEVQRALIRLFPDSKEWIKIDSIIGPNTRGAMNRYRSVYKDNRELSDPSFQRDLITKSQMPDIEKSSAVNFFLVKTADRAAATNFLVEQGINPLTSTFDPNWTAKLTPWQLEQYNKLLTDQQDTISTQFAPQPASIQSHTQVNPKILEVQQALNTLRYPGKDTKPLNLDGRLGANTQFAINNYRSQRNIDPSTQQELVYQYIIADAKKEGTPTITHPTVAKASLYEIINNS